MQYLKIRAEQKPVVSVQKLAVPERLLRTPAGMLCTPAQYSSHVEQVMGNQSTSQDHGLNLTYLQRKTYGMPHWIRMIWPTPALWGCMMLRVES